MSSPQRGRGRPATVSAADLARTALALWDRHGYDNVPLSEVAASAGITERTLFRYFASKSDIVWQAIDTSFTDLQRHLAATPARRALMARVRLGVVASVDIGDGEGAELDRVRFRIISRTPELYGNSSAPFAAWRAVIQNFVAEQLSEDPEGLTPRAAAAAIQATTMSALVWWASHDAGDASAAVDQALRQLESGFRPVRRTGSAPAL